MSAPENTLFAFHDFIRPGEQPLYAELDDLLRTDLAPAGILEHNLVDEIRRAMWRLRRCGIVEENLAAQGDSDPMQLEAQFKIQQNVDRARAQAHRFIHKCTAELRRLQTDRKYRNETFEAGTDISDHGLTDWRSVRKGLDQDVRADHNRAKLADKIELNTMLATPIRPTSSFCKTENAA